MSARPRPKPRPVAKFKPSSSTTVNLNAASSPAQSPSSSVTQNSTTRSKIDDDNDDALFLRNRGRTQQHWNKLRELTKDTPSNKADEDDINWGESVDSESSSRHRKKKQNKQHELPRWQAADIVSLLSSDIEEDDFEFVENTPKASRNNASPRKRKRDRSRSRSITPPPQLPMHQLNNARNLVRQALAFAPRTPSPVQHTDDSTDTSDLNPELAKIAEEVRGRALAAKSGPEQGGGPEVVTIKVRWRPHPLNEAGAKDVWGFKMKRHDTFHDLFEELADLAAVLVDHLFVSHDGKRLFSSGTPHGLRIWAEGELEACDQKTWDYIRTHRHQQSPDTAQPSHRSPSVERYSDAESEVESTGGDTLKLVLRSAATEDKSINLTVRPTTTCGAIVKAFLKAAGISDQYPASSLKSKKAGQAMPQLMIDGDKMADNMEIGEADLDDGDLVEVVGL